METTLPSRGSKVELSFGCENRMASATAVVADIDEDRIVLDIDGGDNTMTPEPGTDIYLLKGGGLYYVLESKHFPRITVEKVHERLHARVDDILTVGYRRVQARDYPGGEEQAQMILRDVFGDIQHVPDVENVTPAMLYRLLYQLNLKVDRLMDMANLGRDKSFRLSGLERVNISASGIRFTMPEKPDPDEIIALRLDLPLETVTRLEVLGKVVSITPDDKGDGYRVSIAFTDLPEDMKETITRYVFRKQRELLRR